MSGSPPGPLPEPGRSSSPALNAVLTYTLGFVALEAPRMVGVDSAASPSSASLDRIYGALDRGEFPNTFAVNPAPGALVSKQQFDFGLDALLPGDGSPAGRCEGQTSDSNTSEDSTDRLPDFGTGGAALSLRVPASFGSIAAARHAAFTLTGCDARERRCMLP